MAFAEVAEYATRDEDPPDLFGDALRRRRQADEIGVVRRYLDPAQNVHPCNVFEHAAARVRELLEQRLELFAFYRIVCCLNLLLDLADAVRLHGEALELWLHFGRGFEGCQFVSIKPLYQPVDLSPDQGVARFGEFRLAPFPNPIDKGSGGQAEGQHTNPDFHVPEEAFERFDPPDRGSDRRGGRARPQCDRPCGDPRRDCGKA